MSFGTDNSTWCRAEGLEPQGTGQETRHGTHPNGATPVAHVASLTVPGAHVAGSSGKDVLSQYRQVAPKATFAPAPEAHVNNSAHGSRSTKGLRMPGDQGRLVPARGHPAGPRSVQCSGSPLPLSVHLPCLQRGLHMRRRRGCAQSKPLWVPTA
jgi:hypothetical protein